MTDYDPYYLTLYKSMKPLEKRLALALFVIERYRDVSHLTPDDQIPPLYIDLAINLCRNPRNRAEIQALLARDI